MEELIAAILKYGGENGMGIAVPIGIGTDDFDIKSITIDMELNEITFD